MGRKKKDNPLDYINLPSMNINPEIKRHVWALFILTVVIVSVLGLTGDGGTIGAYLRIWLTWLFGWGRWLAPISLSVWVIFIFFRDRLEIKALHYLGLILFFLSALMLLQLTVHVSLWPIALAKGEGGGHVGYWLGLAMVNAIGLLASYIISFFVILVSAMFIFNTTLFNILDKASRPMRYACRPIGILMSWLSGRSFKKEAKEESLDEEPMDDEDVNNKQQTTNSNEDEDIIANDEPTFEQKIMPAVKPVIDEAVNIWSPTGVNINLSLELLENRLGKPKSGDVKECSRIIQSTLSNFGIVVDMDEVSVGPTVTQYSLRPADGVKLSKITNLQNNLSMALAAHPLRIEAPIPGKPLVGIEVPNKAIATVGLREIIASDQFKSKGNKLTFALGKDVANKPWVGTIDTMPHLMVAGQTGSGKSVMINSIIISLLYNNNPDDLRLIMIDPKRVELTQYNDIPHLLTPVITDVSKTINALKWTINEMDRRLRLLEKFKKKDIISFNQVAKQKLPYIVFIIDELADLMMLSGKEVEPGIVRIAQMARAVGIHLILATQRPSVNVITGLIKANMPARIAFAVASGIDSRTILDTPGAEKLLGRGDMLYTNASMSKPKRIQGAFVSEKEIRRVVMEIKRQSGKPQYLEGITEKQKVSGSFAMGMVGNDNGGGDDDDPLMEEAKQIILNANKASATMLQKYLSIGYARASRLIDLMEAQGIIGPGRGAKPREILINKAEYDRQQLTVNDRQLIDDRSSVIIDNQQVTTEMEDEEEEEEMPEDVIKEDESEVEIAIDNELPAVSESADESQEADVDFKQPRTKTTSMDDEDFDHYFSR